MKPLRGIGWACALWLLGISPGPLQAAWHNVFQVCCDSCGQRSVSSYAPDPCCNPCPQVCTTRYVQRCYYQPVTTYETRSYYEAVTTYRTSYYYEPVTSYRYTSYYDPCTCSYQQVACPTTCYRLRSQCCPVQSWVQRCCQVPVTSYRQCSYWEPVTSCYTPAVPACAPTSVAVPATPGVTTEPPVTLQPGVSEGRAPMAPMAPGVRESSDRGNGGSGSPLYDKYYGPPQSPTMPPATGSSLRQLPPRLPVTPPPPAPAQPPAKVKLEQIVAVPGPTLEGQVVRQNHAPLGGAKLTFVSTAPNGPWQSATSDAAGRFRVTLASGGWLVYVHGADDKPVLDRKIELRDKEKQQVTLVSR